VATAVVLESQPLFCGLHLYLFHGPTVFHPHRAPSSYMHALPGMVEDWECSRLPAESRLSLHLLISPVPLFLASFTLVSNLLTLNVAGIIFQAVPPFFPSISMRQ
jgi:hypothetical protein